MSQYINKEEKEEIQGIMGKCKRKQEFIEDAVLSYKRANVGREACEEPSPRKEGRRETKYQCSKCRKKLRVTAVFECKCGSHYCGAHRYSDEHGCRYDYRAQHMKKIELENPRVVPVKILKF